MPKLQFLTAHLHDQDDKKVPERVPKTLYTSKAIIAKCDMSSSTERFTVRLSSGPIPFDMVVKLFLDGVFLTGRCFLSGNMEPICDYQITHDHPPGGFLFQRPFSKVQVTLHKCFLGTQIPSEATNRSGEPLSVSSSLFCPGLPIIADWTNTPPVILHEEQEPCLSITWECSRPHPQK